MQWVSTVIIMVDLWDDKWYGNKINNSDYVGLR